MIFFYGMLQASIAVGFLCHLGLLRVWQILGSRASAAQMKRLSQALFLASLLFPGFIPSTMISKAALFDGIRMPIAESVAGLSQTTSAPILNSKFTTGGTVSAKPWPSFPTLTFEQLLLLFIGGGVLIGMMILMGDLRRLRSLLLRSYCFRNTRGLILAVSSEISVPFSFWFFGKRWILFPEEVLGDRIKFRISLKHEMQHHRAKDSVWALGFDLLRPFFLFNPLFLLWKRSILEFQEFSCDEVLIGRKSLSPRKYGDCLVEVAEAALRNQIRLAGVAGMANLSESKTSLERRIRMLMDYKKNRPNSRLLNLMAAFSLMIVAGATVSIRAIASISASEPNPGVAAVDSRVQEIAERYLTDAVSKFHATSGFAVVSEAQTGRVLAVANVNSDPSRPHSPHWALSLRVEPASLMKAVIAAAAIEAGATQPDEVHNCERGKLLIGDKEYGDWKPFSKLTTAEAVAQSSNICGIKVARKLGAEKVAEALKNFGFADPKITARFPEARSGLLPKIGDFGSDQYVARVSSGFGIYTTPLEIVQAFGAIANGGKLLEPLQATEVAKNDREPLRRVLSLENAKKVREILGKVMTEGTAIQSQSKMFVLAGKTGTAHSPWLADSETAAKDSQVAHFVGFGPLENPKYVVYVGIQDPKNEKDHKAHGSGHAAPVFRDIIESLLKG